MNMRGRKQVLRADRRICIRGYHGVQQFACGSSQAKPAGQVPGRYVFDDRCDAAER